jgi:predicted nuclease of predicted toxin-antitoxin system
VSIRLLLDENIAPKLVGALDDLYPGSQHVTDVGLTAATDLRIWDFAKENGYIVVTKDKDFREFSLDMGAPPKLIWIGMGNCSTREIERALRDYAIRISTFAESEQTSLLIIVRT